MTRGKMVVVSIVGGEKQLSVTSVFDKETYITALASSAVASPPLDDILIIFNFLQIRPAGAGLAGGGAERSEKSGQPGSRPTSTGTWRR